jgi:hypothetical protein
MDEIIKPRILEKPIGETQVEMYAVELKRTRMQLPRFKPQCDVKRCVIMVTVKGMYS